MTIKAVLFDLGNTLVYWRPEETLQKILEAHGVVMPVSDVKQAMTKTAKEFDVEEHSNLSAHDFYTKWNIVELEHLGITDRAEAKRLSEEVHSHWFEFTELSVYPDVKDALKRLKKTGFKLGVVTGGFEEDIEKILPKAKLMGFFDVCVGADTTGRRKPHSGAFKYAVRHLGVKPHEAVFVGDNLKADYLGAENAGLIPLLIKRGGSPASNVRTIKRLDEIFEVLEELNP